MRRSDVFRETCPDDLDEVDLRRHDRRSPSALAIVVPILLGVTGLMLVAALHAALGAPFGPAWAAELWDMAKAAIWPTVVAISAGVYVHRNTTRALPAPRGRTTRAIGHASGAYPRLSTGGHRVVQIQASPVDDLGEGEDDGDEEGGRT